MRRRPGPLIVSLLAVACALVCSLAPGPGWVRVPFALTLLLILPGTAVWWALFPHRPPDPLRAVLFSMGLSVVIAVFAGVEMGAYTTASATSWSVLLATITVLAAAIAHRRAPDRWAERPATAVASPRRVRIRYGAIAGAVAATLVIGVAIGLARTPLSVPDDRGYTVLSLDPRATTARSLVVEVSSSEADTRRFRLEVVQPDDHSESLPIVVRPGETIRRRIEIPREAALGPVELLLWDEPSDGGTPYRHLRINMPAPPVPPIPPSSRR